MADGNPIERREIRHFHLFGGLGGGGKGFNNAAARVGSLSATFRCIGSVDVDAAACRDFKRLTGVHSTPMDLFDREQYRAWHGHEPPANWREATPADLQRAAGFERPHIVFLSAPCKGFSPLLNETRSKTDKYQALNALALRGLMLVCEAWGDDPPEFILFENVPRIASRGRHLLDQILSMLARYGYAARETTHDCGQLGGLAQSRRRFLLVARHQEKVPPFLYEPAQRPLRAVGTVLGRCPLPGDRRAGPMHRIPSLQWKTWVRLAFVRAGSDWRSLNELAVADGVLQDYALLPEPPGSQASPVADPRIEGHPKSVQFGLRRWDEAAGVVTGKMLVGGGPHAVADPRLVDTPHSYRIVRWNDVTAGSNGDRHRVADPRASTGFGGAGKYRVTGFDEAAGTVIAGSTTGQGAFAIADPRPTFDRRAGNYLTAGHYGVVSMQASSFAVTGAACHDNGHWSVADPRVPRPDEKLNATIRALDGTWHRPFTTFELAALQSLIDPEEQLELDGLSDSAWRERIGNAVPPAAAQAVAEEIGRTLLLAWTGQTFALSATPVWVRPTAAAIAMPGPQPVIQ